MRRFEHCSIPHKMSSTSRFGIPTGVLDFSALFDVSTRIVLRPHCAGGGGPVPAICACDSMSPNETYLQRAPATYTALRSRRMLSEIGVIPRWGWGLCFPNSSHEGLTISPKQWPRRSVFVQPKQPLYALRRPEPDIYAT